MPVHQSCGLFDTTSPSYGRARFTFDGPMLRPTSTVTDEPKRPTFTDRATLAAIRAQRDFIAAADAGAKRPHAMIPRLVRVKTAYQPSRSFSNRPHLAREGR